MLIKPVSECPKPRAWGHQRCMQSPPEHKGCVCGFNPALPGGPGNPSRPGSPGRPLRPGVPSAPDSPGIPWRPLAPKQPEESTTHVRAPQANPRNDRVGVQNRPNMVLMILGNEAGGCQPEMALLTAGHTYRKPTDPAVSLHPLPDALVGSLPSRCWP